MGYQQNVDPAPPTYGHDRSQGLFRFFGRCGPHPIHPIGNPMHVGIHCDDRSPKAGGQYDVGTLGTDAGNIEQLFASTGHTALVNEYPGKFFQLLGLLSIEAGTVKDPFQASVGQAEERLGRRNDVKKPAANLAGLLIAGAGADEATHYSGEGGALALNRSLVNRSLLVSASASLQQKLM